MDNSGSLNAQIIHQVSSHVRSKLAFQVRYHGDGPRDDSMSRF